MSEIFVAPGVYVRERDFSFYVSSVGRSALALVGETEKGPAFRPTKITNMSDFRSKFGNLNPYRPVGYCARSYFKYANLAYVVRVLGDEPLRDSNASILTICSSGANPTILATLLYSGDTDFHTIATGTSTDSDGFILAVSGTGAYTGTVNLISSTAPNFIGKIFPRTNDISSDGPALQQVFSNAADSTSVSGDASIDISNWTTQSGYYVEGYSNAMTPIIVGDADDANAGTQLFRIYSQSDGQSSNNEIKIAIENIDPDNDSFDIVVRDIDDTNTTPIIYERFPKLSMDKTKQNYIARVIGDNVDEAVAEYSLNSKYIYVSVIENENNELAGLMPYGFNPISSPISSSTSDDMSLPEFSYVTGFTDTLSNAKQWYGLNYTSTDHDLLMRGHSSAWDLTKTTGTIIKGFHLNSGATYGDYYTTGDKETDDYTKFTAKFLVPVLGGNDGWNNYETYRDLLGSDPDSNQLEVWKDGIDAVASTEDFDINLLAVPGVAINSTIGDYAVDIARTRADCLYVGDMPESSTAALAVSNVSSIDSSYACTYWPYVQIYDSDTKQNVLIPPTPQVLEALAYTDSASYPWFAPAGLNRGLMTDVIRAEHKLSQVDIETLYDGKVNPIATFPAQGVSIWGQKTLQTRTTALDRINVRRMLLYVEKVIAGASKYLVFEQNDEETWERFKGMVQPVLDVVRIKRGLYDFRVIMDETTNTPDMIDRNQMIGQIYIQPTKTAEAILINFNILPTGAVFEE